MRLVLLVVHLALPLQAAVYVPPDEAKSLFRRDLLPLDTDTMRELSGHLTDLARRDIGRDPLHWRATAQLLAIATRLDPANRPARDHGKRLVGGDVPPPPEHLDFASAISSAWRIVEWLLQPEAGAEGQRLGHQLVDALHVVDPRHPLAQRHDAAGEPARWEGVVALLPRFEGRDPAPTPPALPSADRPAAEPPPPLPPVERPPIRLREASVSTPLYVYDENSRLQLRLVRVAMNVIESQEPDPFLFRLAPDVRSPALDASRDLARGALERTWPHLPLGQLAVLGTDQQRYASRNTTAISGPAALLMRAALEGTELREDLVFVADLAADGSLTRPRWSWDYVRALRTSEGGRLVVPLALQPDLRAMIALERPEFFLNWEVLVADSLGDALALGRVDGPPKLAEASALFEEIRALGRETPAGPLCVNSHVRRRLQDMILPRAPAHFSASMLLLQGNIERPTRIEREVAARILRSGLDELAYLGKAPLEGLTPSRVDAACKSSRAAIEPFGKYFREEDRDLRDEAVSRVNLAAELARTLEAGLRDGRGNPVSAKGVPVATLQQDLHAALQACFQSLAPYTGEPLPPAPATTQNPP